MLGSVIMVLELDLDSLCVNFEDAGNLPMLRLDFSAILSPVIDTEEGNITSRSLFPREERFSADGPIVEIPVMADIVDIVSSFSMRFLILSMGTTEPAHDKDS